MHMHLQGIVWQVFHRLNTFLDQLPGWDTKDCQCPPESPLVSTWPWAPHPQAHSLGFYRGLILLFPKVLYTRRLNLSFRLLSLNVMLWDSFITFIDVQLFQDYLLKRLFSFHGTAFVPLLQQAILLWAYFCTLHFFPSIYAPIFSRVSYSFNYCGFIVHLKIV